MENIHTAEYLEQRNTRFLESRHNSIDAGQNLAFLERLNMRLHRGEVIGHFEPKPRGPKGAEMWEKYMGGNSSL